MPDVLRRALEEIEHCQQETPDAYGHPRVVMGIAMVKSAIKLAQEYLEYLDGVYPASVSEGKAPEPPIVPGEPEMTERSLKSSVGGAVIYAELLLDFVDGLDKEQKLYFELLGFNFERWNEAVEYLLGQLDLIFTELQADENGD